MKVEQFKNRWYKIIFLVVGVSVLIFYALRGRRADLEIYDSSMQVIPEQVEYCNPDLIKLQKEYSEFIGKVVYNILENENISKETSEKFNAIFALKNSKVYAALRVEGRKISEAWGEIGAPFQSLQNALSKAAAKLSAVHRAKINSVELDVAYNFSVVDPKDESAYRKLRQNIQRGISGLKITAGVHSKLFSPTYSIATNRTSVKLIEMFKQQYGITDEDFKKNGELSRFDAYQILVIAGKRAYFMERGNTLVKLNSVSNESIDKSARLAADWLANNVHHDGRMTYKYWPSNGNESESNNMIRQWMATVALGRAADYLNRSDLRNLETRNINYNLSKFYKKEGEFGLIEYRGKVKLGALALAALAIVEHPQRPNWQDEEKSLLRTIESLWNNNGSFATFFKPAGRSDNQNFYPGEALLLWATLYEQNRDESLLSKIMKSFNYYKSWHLDASNRNPAFIPWHTQAYYKIWKITKNEALLNFIFTMNDWLLDVLQWDENPEFCDIQGRFYDPDRPFGPPHSSSTGVYLEGLIDAFNLAREVEDNVRMDNYRNSIRRGLRSVEQLQFQDEIDMFYTSWGKRNYVKGGIRTTVYNNEIRCDNVQHNLMGMLKILHSIDELYFH